MEIVPIALETVRDLLVAEAEFLHGVSNQVREVEIELRSMQAFLKEADKRQFTDERIRDHVREIRRLAYGIEDVLDNFAIKVASHRKGHGMKKVLKRYACIFDECLALHKVGTEIEDIKTRLANARASFDRYGVSVIPFAIEDDGQSYNSKLQRQTYPDEIEECFVGMDEDIKCLVPLIIDYHENAHRVITIHGMGGLGKTTLARKIYNHDDVQKCFEALAWVTITQKLDKETILRDFLKGLLPYSRKDSVTNMRNRELVEELRKEQKNRKCLVVLDDMWETGQWNELSSAFPGGNSKVLITTRKKTLTDIGLTYSLGFLSEDEGWELLRMKAFGKTIPEDVKMDAAGFENIGREMVRRCGYLPLAISVLGGILRERRSLAYWKDVSKDVDSYLTRSDKSDEEYGRTLQVLALSYNSLPYHLKPCFLHLGQFQEDEDIEVETLYLMWIAEGMISSSHRRKEEDTLMDVAEMYLIEMANRSMVQVKAVDDDVYSFPRLDIVSCRLHDLWRDFCLAYGEKVEFLKILDFQGGKDPVSNSADDQSWRYSIYMDSDARREDMVNMALGGSNGHLRSFYLRTSLLFGDTHIKFSFFQKLKFLRVLLIENYDFVDRGLPEGIKKLIHLRFLGLKRCTLKKLPQWISKLQHLQVLAFRDCGPIEVPNCLWKLKQLRHIYFPHEWPEEFKGKVKLTGLTSLETLDGFNDKINEIEDLSEMINLRVLVGVLNGNKNLTQFVNHANNHLHKLQKILLGVDYTSTQDTNVVVPLQDVFKCIGLHGLEIRSGACDFKKFEAPSTSNLIWLNLIECKIKGDPMEPLGKLSNLQSLRLCQSESLDEGFICENMFCDSNAFPKLRSLKLDRFRSLKEWVVCEGAMPNLFDLGINSCHGLEMIPDGLRFLTALKKLEIWMPKSFNDRIRGIDGKKGVDFDKVSHVPFISYFDWHRGMWPWPPRPRPLPPGEIEEDGHDASLCSRLGRRIPFLRHG